MSVYQQRLLQLRQQPKIWLVTGVAGFIGSNLLESLLSIDQTVIGLDNFATGHQRNLDAVQDIVNEQQWDRFTFINGDICDFDCCQKAVRGVDYVLHQAALGSVPRSIADPIRSNTTNVSGFLNMLVASRDAKVTSFTYAASSSTYGDHPALPKVEHNIGNPLSPYAVTKYVNELYADVFARCYDFPCIGLRYFNVFGPRQDPNGAYAAVIPRWIATLLKGGQVTINGEGDTSRDFCYVQNAIQANLLAATAQGKPNSQVYNVAVGDRTSLNELYDQIHSELVGLGAEVVVHKPEYAGYRAGDVRHSQADIAKIIASLGYSPEYNVTQGLKETVQWFFEKHLEKLQSTNVT